MMSVRRRKRRRKRRAWWMTKGGQRGAEKNRGYLALAFALKKDDKFKVGLGRRRSVRMRRID